MEITTDAAKGHPGNTDARGIPRADRDRSGENFKKRWNTLVNTLSELHYDYGAKFHFSMIRKRQSYVCRYKKGLMPLGLQPHCKFFKSTIP